MVTVITYGTFDMFHIGHLRILERARSLGDRLVVGVSTDEFNELKGKKCFFPYEDRIEIVKSIKFVDHAFPEKCWEQKEDDIMLYQAKIFVMGDDWKGKFDYLKDKLNCEVIYLPRTNSISTTQLKQAYLKRIEQTISFMQDFSDLIRTLG